MKVYFIGAGPGDPELLTRKAEKIIKKADIIIYAGSLINRQVLKFAKKSAQVYDSSRMNLDEVLAVILKAKPRNALIARVHSGEPSIYGAIQEQIDWCEKEGIDCAVIPGISSFQAAAASLKQELTLPGVAQTVILTRISGRTKVPPKATKVIFLSTQLIKKAVRELKKEYRGNTAVAVVEKASWPKERRIFGTLDNIAQKVKQSGIRRQALIIVGDVLNKKYEKSKLYDSEFTHGFRHSNK